VSKIDKALTIDLMDSYMSIHAIFGALAATKLNIRTAG